MKNHVRLVAVTAIVALLALSAVAPATAGGGNSAAAKLCQKDGWQTLFREDGTPFKNAGDCVSHAARGGLFAAPASPSNVSASIVAWDPGTCTITVDVSWDDNSLNETGFVIGPPTLPAVFPGFPGFALTGPDTESTQFTLTYGGGLLPVFVWAYIQVGDQFILSDLGNGLLLTPTPPSSCLPAPGA